MLSYHSDSAIKARYLARVEGHAAADEIIKGQYWEAGKGCAVGCTVHGASHDDFERELGIPQMLAWLEDVIFEGLPNRRAKDWPLAFLSAIDPGRDLSVVGWKFLHWLLAGRERAEFVSSSVADAVEQCAAVLVPLTRGEPVDRDEADDASAMARAAMERTTAGASAAGAWIAECAARAAESAALSLACSATSAEVAATAVSAAVGRSGEYVELGDKLLALLRAA